jgi:lipopolysaccharide export system protein LptA
MPRISRIAGSFAIVVIAYWAYALVAVRWIEPHADLNPANAITVDNRSGARRLPDLQLEQLQGLFPPDSWELQNPMMLESDHAKLLLQLPKQYNRPDGWLEIKRCTIVIPFEGPAENEEQRRRQSIIIQSPEGARLKFDQPLDLASFKFGRLTGGQLNGQVTIHSDWKDPGPEDDLWIVTSKITLNEQTISTKETVDFRWGPHSGRGQGMTIKLLADQSRAAKAAKATSGMKFSGIEFFELSHVERLRLDLEQATPTSGDKPDHAPIDITCRGPFRFDAVGHVATFREQVDVMKLNPVGPADQLECDLLSIFFIPPPRQKPRAAAKKGVKSDAPFDLVPQKIEARGNPVVARVPSMKEHGGIVTVRGPRLEYDKLANNIVLDGDSEVCLQQGANEIHARNIHYQSAGQDRLGQVTAQGPGWLRGQSPDRPNQQLEVVWQDKLLIHPREQLQEIALTGGAELRFPGVGQLQAPEIFFWLIETAAVPGTSQPNLRPKSMLARNNVRITSPQLAGVIWDQLEVWFKEGATSVARMSAVSPSTGVVGATFNGPAVERLPLQSAASQATPAQTAPQFQIAGKNLRAQVLLGDQPGDQPGVANLEIEGDVRFEGSGMTLSGPNINVDGENNRMSIDGPGQMQFPIAEFLQDQTQTTPGVLTVDWRNHMNFDGLKATFEGPVVATTTQHQELNTAVMEVKLHRPIRFADANLAERPQVEEIQCSGGVLMKNRSFDPRQQQISLDQLQVTDLAINVMSGAVNAGPGWLNSVNYQSADMLGSQFASVGKAPANAARPPDKRFCLHVQFQKSITGNIGTPGNMQRGSLIFSDRVRMTYGPVDNWDAMLTATDPERLGPEGIVAQCDQLKVAKTVAPTTRLPSIGLEAAGNAKVDGTDFAARGKRITFDQAKELVILEGDGRNNAELYRQLQPGAARTLMPAQKIMYWIKTKQAKIIDPQSLDFNQLFNASPK